MTSTIENYGASRHVGAGFAPLAELLPLDTPLSLMVDPSNVCNFRCVFCPTGDSELLAQVGRPKGMMTIELFAKIINDLSDFPNPLRAMHLYKDGEPLVNPEFANMIRLAKQSGRVGRVETTTNGALLKPAKGRELIEAGIDGMRVSVYGLDDVSYRETTGVSAKFDVVRSNVEAFFQLKSTLRPEVHLHCKITDVGLSDEQKSFFIESFRGISDSVHIDSLMGWSNTIDRDMTLGKTPQSGMSGAPLDAKRQVCSELFMKMCVNFDGSVSVCCVDWAHETAVGDVCSERLIDIWNGEKLRDLRVKHLTGRRSEINACNGCGYIQGLPPYTSLDQDAERLLPLYHSK